MPESNLQRSGYEPGALPVELTRHNKSVPDVHHTSGTPNKSSCTSCVSAAGLRRIAGRRAFCTATASDLCQRLTLCADQNCHGKLLSRGVHSGHPPGNGICGFGCAAGFWSGRRVNPLSTVEISKCRAMLPAGMSHHNDDGPLVTPNVRIMIIAYRNRTFRTFRTFRTNRTFRTRLLRFTDYFLGFVTHGPNKNVAKPL